MDNRVWRKNPERHPTGNELVYLRYRNGLIVGPVPKSSRRWVQWPSGPSPFDIAEYALAE
jgi:hypothetical protein